MMVYVRAKFQGIYTLNFYGLIWYSTSILGSWNSHWYHCCPRRLQGKLPPAEFLQTLGRGCSRQTTGWRWPTRASSGLLRNWPGGRQKWCLFMFVHVYSIGGIWLVGGFSPRSRGYFKFSKVTSCWDQRKTVPQTGWKWSSDLHWVQKCAARFQSQQQLLGGD